MCRSPEKEAKPEKSSKSSSSSGSTGSSSSSTGPNYSGPVAAEVTKSNPLSFCPTGFFSDQENNRCVTDLNDAPKTVRKTGTCPSGTMEESGGFCTASVTDASDAMIDRLSGRAIRDFNAVYLALQIASKPLPKDQENPAALAAAIAKRSAEGNPYKTPYQRDQEKNAPAQAAALKAANDEQTAKDKSREDAMRSACQQQLAAGIQQPQCMQYANSTNPLATAQSPAAAASTVQSAVKDEASKALGGVLKGLFGK